MVPTKIFQHKHISTRTFITIVLLILHMNISLYYLATIIYTINLLCNIPSLRRSLIDLVGHMRA